MKRTMITLRVPEERLEEIDRLADKAGLSRTEYMVRASLGEITDPRDADARFEDLDQRLRKLERDFELTH